MSEIKGFNLNDYIYVKLTDIGKKELKRQHQKLVDSIDNYESPYIPLKEDDNGFVKMQGWCLMRSFGHLCVMGCGLPFETSMKIEVESK